MATLTRVKSESPHHDQPSTLSGTIPAPFSLEERARVLGQHTSEGQHALAEPQSSSREEAQTTVEDQPVASSSSTTQDVIPSIAYVQNSALMTLNDLLSSSPEWRTIVPDRRHSVPAHASSSKSKSAPLDSIQPKAALETLLSNLRSREMEGVDGGGEMVESRMPTDEAGMLYELQHRIDTLVPSLSAENAELAVTLTSLLSHLNRLSAIDLSPTSSPPPSSGSFHDSDFSTDVFDTLSRQLSDFQFQRLAARTDVPEEGLLPVVAVEKALLWTRVDENLETVLRLCRQRTEGIPRQDYLPPQYDIGDYELDPEGPPEYDYGSAIAYQEKEKAQASSSTAPPQQDAKDLSEKMRLDLDAVTMAIDRLYLVAPQLHNQRVELRSSKREELERAARSAGPSSHDLQKMKERELDDLLGKIGKASERKLVNQTVVLEGGMKMQMERARQRDVQKRQEFVEKLMEHSAGGRLNSQDATFTLPKIKDPHALLTLPEFIRESVPKSMEAPPDPQQMMTLPEFVRDSQPSTSSSPPSSAVPERLSRRKSSKGLRSRSMSAPALNWLRPRTSSEATRPKSNHQSRPTSSSSRPTELDVVYVAEHHDNLHHILAFLTVSGTNPGAPLEAEVLDSSPPRLILRSASTISPPLSLPAHSSPGPREVRAHETHYEIKLSTAATVRTPTTPSASASSSFPLIDATQLLSTSPTSFICASCSLPLVQSGKITRYDDLPSEHWGELVDAWMCHADQGLNEQVARHAKGGFWPERGQALVGGSYILFEESAVMRSNLWTTGNVKHEEDWKSVRCICGSYAGRCQDYANAEGEKVVVYRLVKYAIRPVSLSAELKRIPLSAFIVEDMMEYVQAHATYRFYVVDEEEEKPRLLVWLFKPNIRLSYLAPSSYSIPRRGTIQAAKVLFKILGPSPSSLDISTVLEEFPGFPQAEQLLYPMEVCRRLAIVLRESNKCYPEPMRTMTGLDVGWLLRA